jgi:GntR family transcriptional regulator
MLVTVDANSGVPVFRQILEQVRFQIASGVLRAGAELPSTRALSQKLGINPMTVSKAYSMLEEEGLLERRPGLPLVVRALAGPEAEEARMEQLATVLVAAVLAARQLGVSHNKATTLFRRMLDEAAHSRDKAS